MRVVCCARLACAASAWSRCWPAQRCLYESIPADEVCNLKPPRSCSQMAIPKPLILASVALLALCAFAAAADKPAKACQPVDLATAAPADLRARKVTPTSVEFSWAAPKARKDACLDTYNFYILKAGEAARLQSNLPTRTSIKCGAPIKRAASYTATGLKPGTEYEFNVNIANAKGASKDARLIVKTKAA